MTGWTASSEFPTTTVAYDTSYNGSTDAFVVRLKAAGSGLEYATFLGGSSIDIGNAIAVDGAGRAYVTGETSSSNFPTTPGAYDRDHGGGGVRDALVVRLNAGGSDLEYGTFLGGSGEQGTEWGLDFVLDGAGRAYVTGWTWGPNFPTTPGAYDTSHKGEFDAFVVRLNPAGNGSSDLEYATFLGGSGDEGGWRLVMDGAGKAYVAGWTASSDFPTTPGAYDTSHNGKWDAFVARLGMGEYHLYLPIVLRNR